MKFVEINCDLKSPKISKNFSTLMELSTERKNKITEVYKKRQKDLVVILENVNDPHNVSAVLRSCDAVGIDIVYLVYPEKNFPELSETSSASASKWVKTKKFISIKDCIDELHRDGFSVYATYLGEGSDSKSIYDVDFTGPVGIILGNERDGVTKEAVGLCDGNILIPMVGMVQSLNISVANAVILYEVFRQRLESGSYQKSQYSDKEIASILEEDLWSKIKRRLTRK